MNHQRTNRIETERLVLRRFKKNDAEEVFYNYGGDEKIAKYISWIPCNSLEKTCKFIEYNLNEYENNEKHYSWVITFNDVIIGSIAIFNVNNDNDSGELGYSLGSRWWNNGFVTEVCEAILDYAFGIIGFNRIFASCHVDNIASRRVMEKIGMSYEGTLRDGQKNLDGTFSNLLLYSILKSEYDK